MKINIMHSHCSAL